LPLDATFWGPPVADEIDAAAEWCAYNAEVRRVAFAAFSRQLLALCDEHTPQRFLDLAHEWAIEALR
jgi:hypothetical protein